MANIGSRLTEKDDQGTITEIDEHTRHAIDLLKSMQNPLQDYADIVGAPAFAHGYRYVYPEPEDYAIETAIIALEERSRNRWIPVTERLPEKDGFYLATHDGEICGEEEPFVGLAEFENGKWVDDEEDYQCIFAWQPLPAPYKPATEQDNPSGWQEQMMGAFLGDSRL